jgi:NADPH-dependent curcumin reductase
MFQENRALVLRRRPEGEVRKEDFELITTTLEFPPPTADGAHDTGDAVVLVKNLYVSVDPAHRIWISDTAVYVSPVPLNSVMRARTLGVIVQTTCDDDDDDEWAVGTHVVGSGGVQDYYVGGASVGVPLQKVPSFSTKYLSVCSFHIGFTAWLGVHKILKIPRNLEQDGEFVVVVSGAAGAVGSLAGQLCKLSGATKVIGIAGGPEKCHDLVAFFGFDHAVDYKNEDVEQSLKNLAPGGVHCYFDNVGGPVTDAVLRNMRFFGRVAVCGSISEYNDEWTGIRNWNLVLQKRLTVKGFICSDHAEDYGASFPELCELEEAGKLRYREDVRPGVENYVDILNLLFRGENKGKLMIQV